LTLPLQDMAEGVSDVRMMHDDVSEGMKQLKVFFADKLIQVKVFLVILMLMVTVMAVPPRLASALVSKLTFETNCSIADS
jgi:hypothetical protein